MYEKTSDVEKKFHITDFPLSIAIEPSNHCNLNCICCANNKLTRPRGRMDIYLYKKLIDEIAAENPYTRLWLDYYGEPLLQGFRLFYMIDYAKKSGLKNICMNTNGTLINREMAEMLLDSGIDFISIDCDGFSKEVYEQIRVNANRDVMYANTEYLLQRKKERGLKTPIIEVKAMEMKENKHEIDQIINYWRERGAWTTKRRLISWGGSVEEIRPEERDNRIACGNAVGIITITWDDKATLCVMDINADNACGDVTKESLKKIWQRRNKEFVALHMEHRFDELPEICQKCTDWEIIGEERYDENGNRMDKSYEEHDQMLTADGDSDA